MILGAFLLSGYFASSDKQDFYIVAKVDELMALCDQLQAQINQIQTTQIHLADAMPEQALI
jgi:type I restriction enzyme S subunit